MKSQAEHFMASIKSVKADLLETQGRIQLSFSEQTDHFRTRFEELGEDIDSQNDKLSLNFHDVREHIKGSVQDLTTTLERGSQLKQREQLAGQRELLEAVHTLHQNIKKHGLVAAILPVIITILLFGKLCISSGG